MHKYFEINEGGHAICCKLYFAEQQEIKRVVICPHGFVGSKDDEACEEFSERLLEESKDTAVVVFDWPCHGDDATEELRLSDCMAYLDAVIRYCLDSLQVEELYTYGVSFGGYLVLRYIREYGNPFKRIALRCPAVNMRDVLTDVIMKDDEHERIRKGERVAVGFAVKVEVGLPFLNELAENDVQNMGFRDYAEDALILHGTDDEIVPFDVCARFAENNLIKLIAVEGADHRFLDPGCMDIATRNVLEFFGL